MVRAHQIMVSPLKHRNQRVTPIQIGVLEASRGYLSRILPSVDKFTMLAFGTMLIGPVQEEVLAMFVFQLP